MDTNVYIMKSFMQDIQSMKDSAKILCCEAFIMILLGHVKDEDRTGLVRSVRAMTEAAVVRVCQRKCHIGIHGSEAGE